MKMTKKAFAAGTLLPAAFLLAAGPGSAPPKLPLGLLPISWPADNPYSAAKAELGRTLYFDKRLSFDGSVSCASCHSPQFGFADGSPVSSGIKGQKGGRSAPTVINRAWSLAQFWDGRAPSLEAQAVGPMANPIEMGNTHAALVQTLRAFPATSPCLRRHSTTKM